MIGKVIAERYEIISLLGTGGMAKVYKARDLNLGREVALKVLLDNVAKDPEFKERFHREARASAVLTHPNIVQVYDFFESEDGVFLVMELISGCDLKDRMLQTGALPVDEAINICMGVLEALAFAHSKGIVHRDISARNVMIEDGGGVKVADFGIARVVGERTLTQSGELIGSVQYISPEQASGGRASYEADVYSAGVLLYEMLTGELPFCSDNAVKLALMHIQSPVPKPSAIRSEISEALDSIVLKAMAKSPQQRFRSAVSMMEALSSLRAPGPSFAAVPMRGADSSFNGAQTAGQSAAAGAALAAGNTERTMLRTRIPQNLVRIQEEAARASRAETAGQYGFSDSNGTDSVDLTLDDEAITDIEDLEGAEEYSDDTEYGTDGSFEDDGAENYEDGGGEGASLGRKGLGAVIAITLTILLAFAAGVTWVNMNSGTKINVPNVVGQRMEQARTSVEEAGLRMEVRSQKFDSSMKPGIVIDQDPKGGVGAVKDGVVFVDVSAGRSVVSIPDLDGMSEDRARQELENMGLVCSVVMRSSDVVPAGMVFGQDPASGREASAGSEVTIVVSTGKVQIDVPDLKGMEVERAAEILAGFKAELKVSARKADPKAKANTIISQTPAPGSRLKEGDVVSVVVCSGETASKAAPNLVGLSLMEARAQAKSLGIELAVDGDQSEGASVVSQQAAPGSVLKDGRLNISCASSASASSAAEAEVPNVCSMGYGQAVEALQNAGFKVGRVSAVSGETPNIVISQAPAPGHSAAPGTMIDLTVTKAAAQSAPAESEQAPVPSPAVPENSSVEGIHQESAPLPSAEKAPAADGGIELPGDLP